MTDYISHHRRKGSLTNECEESHGALASTGVHILSVPTERAVPDSLKLLLRGLPSYDGL